MAGTKIRPRDLLNHIYAEMLELRQQGVQPTEVHLTRDDEAALIMATAKEIGGDAVSDITLNGARGAFPILYGLATKWDADRTKVC